MELTVIVTALLLHVVLSACRDQHSFALQLLVLRWSQSELVMRRGGLMDLLVLLTPLSVTGTLFECSGEFRREGRLYPECIPTSCGRVMVDISEGQC